MKPNRLFLIAFILLTTSILAQKIKPDVIKENLKGDVKSVHYKTYEAEKRDGKTELKNPTNIGLNVLNLYNSKGYLIEERQFISARDGNRISKTSYERDSKNLIIKESYAGISNKYNYVLLKNDKHEIIIKYHDNSERIYLFDKNGNKISEMSHKDAKTYYTITYEYDQFGRNIKENYVNEYYDINEYDNKGNRQKWTRYKPDGKLIFAYKIDYTKYDSKGNWLESIDYDITNDNSGIPLIITKREIEYF